MSDRLSGGGGGNLGALERAKACSGSRPWTAEKGQLRSFGLTRIDRYKYPSRRISRPVCVCVVNNFSCQNSTAVLVRAERPALAVRHDNRLTENRTLKD